MKIASQVITRLSRNAIAMLKGRVAHPLYMLRRIPLPHRGGGIRLLEHFTFFYGAGNNSLKKSTTKVERENLLLISIDPRLRSQRSESRQDPLLESHSSHT